MQTQPLRLTPGRDLKVELDTIVRTRNWSAAFVLGGIGSLRKAVIRFADRDSATVLEGPLEILHLGGTLSPDGSHLHILVSDADGTATGGHLKEGAIIRTTAEVLLGILPEWEFGRGPDDLTGYPELTVRRREEAR